MKKIKELFSADMARAVLYRSVTKGVIALVLILLWDRYLNEGYFFLVRDGFLVAALVLFMSAWIHYLRLDGIRINPPKRVEKKERPAWSRRDIADYMDEHIVGWDELDREERIVCSLLSSLLPGLVFLVPALIALML